MSFINWLQEETCDYDTWVNSFDTNNTKVTRMFKPIQVDVDVWLSVQASSVHCSRPQSDYVDPKDITHWEILVFSRNGIKRIREVLPHFKSLAEIELYYLGMYAFVPTDLVSELFTALMFENRITA